MYFFFLSFFLFLLFSFSSTIPFSTYSLSTAVQKSVSLICVFNRIRGAEMLLSLTHAVIFVTACKTALSVILFLPCLLC
jgi:hypothetical protein